jgi:tetraprenyl-beta-curcumene synthase
MLANARYWTTVAPLVHTQLSRWERRAQAIADPALRAPAASKLQRERFNVEMAATLATLATRSHRKCVVEAIVALQVMYDYLDLLTEQPLLDPLADGRRLFGALADALSPEREPCGDYGGYLRELVSAARLALARLPAAGAIAEVARRSARRCAEAQVISHAAARTGTAAAGGAAGGGNSALEQWARREAAGTALEWPEFLAGAAASVLAVHALVAAAADRRTTPADAEAIDAVYLSIGALTMLDSLVDREEDIDTGELGYVHCYESAEQMGRRLASVAAEATAGARVLPNAPHHIMTVVGVVAYYTSAPAARSPAALPVTAQVRGELRPLIEPTLALMRAWRLAKLIRSRWPGAPAAVR